MEYPERRRSIKEWTAQDRPREKLLERGINSLTDAELLAILLGSGTTTLSAVELGQHLLERFGGLERLSQCSVRELTQVKGIGPAKAISIVAGFEIARRRQMLGRDEVVIQTSEVAAAYLQPKLSDLQREVFHALFLNRGSKIIWEQTFFEGGISETVVDPRLIFKTALEHLCSAMIIAHNHPSGQCRPSQGDLQITRKLAEGCRLLDIQLLDHIIIAGQQYYSFADEGEL